MAADDARRAAREWDARYAGGPVWTREPNVWVRRAVGRLAPGRALDAYLHLPADDLVVATRPPGPPSRPE